MTRIEFYFNVADKHELIENLVHLALAKRRQISILTSDEQASAGVSAYLWQNKPSSFLPNMQINTKNMNDEEPNKAQLNLINAAVTPVVISSHAKALLQDDLLVNLTSNEPNFFSRFTQLIEIIGLDVDDKSAGRQRYKFYRDRGYEIKNIDLATYKLE